MAEMAGSRGGRLIAGATALALFLAALLVPAAQAAMHTVNAGDRIQDAVQRAAAGDVIRVMPGIYEQTVYIDKDGISLIGVIEQGRRAILDGARQELQIDVLQHLAPARIGLGQAAHAEHVLIGGHQAKLLLLRRGMNLGCR